MAKEVGYARVSTREQNLDRQIKQLKKYVPEDMIVLEKDSGKNFEDRLEYQSFKHGIGKLVKGDTLYITSLDRLSRNKELAKKELEYYKNIGVRVKIIDIPTTMINIENQEWVLDMINNILIEVLSSVAEAERNNIKQRQREGIEAMTLNNEGKRISNKTGRTLGRPKIEYPSNWKEIYIEWKSGNISSKKAKEKLGIKNNTFYNLVKEYEKKEMQMT